jgi:hypothetical protein
MDLYRLLASPLDQRDEAHRQGSISANDDDPDPYTTLTRSVETSDEERTCALLQVVAI